MNASVPVLSRLEPWTALRQLSRWRRLGNPAYTPSSMPAPRSRTDAAESRFFNDAPLPTAEPTLRVRGSKILSAPKCNDMIREKADDVIEATIKSSRESLTLLQKRILQ